uniref:Endonuclease/exonuclease/phosphatase domain-containing protein n=1 Tax=Plectus sambesii TaxID=2011161 RepID=A0A914X850_9BILA
MEGTSYFNTSARASPGSDAHRLRLSGVTRELGLPRDGRTRLKKQVQTIRIASLNVGSMTGRGRELADVLKKRKVHIACVQEVRWKGEKSRDIGAGYKLIYYGTSTKNGVGVIINEQLRERVLEVRRISERLMAVKIDLPEGPMVIISAYAPQVGCSAEEKEAFWESLDALLPSFQDVKHLIIGGDLNGHVGAARDGYETVHGGCGFGTRNPEGGAVLDAAVAYDLAIANTFFRKRDEHLITFKSGSARTQIDYLLLRRNTLGDVKNCKVIPGDAVASQHRLLVLDLRLKTPLKPRRQKLSPKVKWWEFNTQNRALFEQAMTPQLTMSTNTSTNDMWQPVATALLTTARELLGSTRGGKRSNKETWWWNVDVQEAVQKKKVAFKHWQRSLLPEDRRAYMEAKRAVKQTIAAAKSAHYEDMYQKLSTREGEKAVYRLARARNAATKDIQIVKTIKDSNGTALRRENKIRERWGEYFHTLLNEENARDACDATPPVSGPIHAITKAEVDLALRRMKNGKAVGPDGIPTEAWKACGNTGVTWLTALFNRILESGKMPDAWRSSTIAPIYKKKGDVQQCSNYRGIKLLSHTMKLWERVIDA